MQSWVYHVKCVKNMAKPFKLIQYCNPGKPQPEKTLLPVSRK
jgi:hypothetical protein